MKNTASAATINTPIPIKMPVRNRSCFIDASVALTFSLYRLYDETTSRIPKVLLVSDHYSLYTLSMGDVFMTTRGQSLPTGTVTFLFTDIEGSTKLARQHPERWEAARAKHHS